MCVDMHHWNLFDVLWDIWIWPRRIQLNRSKKNIDLFHELSGLQISQQVFLGNWKVIKLLYAPKSLQK